MSAVLQRCAPCSRFWVCQGCQWPCSGHTGPWLKCPQTTSNAIGVSSTELKLESRLGNGCWAVRAPACPPVSMNRIHAKGLPPHHLYFSSFHLLPWSSPGPAFLGGLGIEKQPRCLREWVQEYEGRQFSSSLVCDLFTLIKIENPKELLFIWAITISVNLNKKWNSMFQNSLFVHLKIIVISLLHVNIYNISNEKITFFNKKI